MPVATTSPRARPWVAVVPLKAMLSRSPSALAPPAANAAVCLAVVTDSPVSADSSTCNCAISINRRSAGTWLPASSNTMSPGTTVGRWHHVNLPATHDGGLGGGQLAQRLHGLVGAPALHKPNRRH